MGLSQAPAGRTGVARPHLPHARQLSAHLRERAHRAGLSRGRVVSQSPDPEALERIIQEHLIGGRIVEDLAFAQSPFATAARRLLFRPRLLRRLKRIQKLRIPRKTFQHPNDFSAAEAGARQAAIGRGHILVFLNRPSRGARRYLRRIQSSIMADSSTFS